MARAKKYEGITVDHAGGWDPSQYRNYVDPDNKCDHAKKYQRESLPKLMPVSRPTRLDKEGNPVSFKRDDKVDAANQKDIKTRNL